MFYLYAQQAQHPAGIDKIDQSVGTMSTTGGVSDDSPQATTPTTTINTEANRQVEKDGTNNFESIVITESSSSSKRSLEAKKQT